MCICSCDEMKTEQTPYLLLPLFCFHACVTLCVFPSTFSAFTSGGVVCNYEPRSLLASSFSLLKLMVCCILLLHSSTPVFYWLFVCVRVCVVYRGCCAHLASVHVCERLDMKEKSADLRTGLLWPRLVVIA